MTDPRVKKLARVLTEYSVKIKAGDKVLLTANPDAWPLAKEIYKLCLQKNSYPYLSYQPDELDYLFFSYAQPRHLTRKPELALFLVNWADKIIRLYSEKNNRSLAKIKPARLLLYERTQQPVKQLMLKKPWVFTQFPSASLAQSAALSLEQLENIYFRACLQDWPRLSRQLRKIKRRLDQAKEVEIIGEKTRLKLSFSGRLFQIGDGHFNLPDGEVFGAPVDTSATGRIYFDLPSLRSGQVVQGVELVFEAGRVTQARAKQGMQYLRAALAIDPGAKRLGEFAIGANSALKQVLFNTLFDEKIGGTIHLALGNAYPEKLGGGTNRSSLHWDLIKTMTSRSALVLVNKRPLLKQGRLMV
jgi:aminopeptidase